MKQRFIVKRPQKLKDPLVKPAVFNAMKQIIKSENKILAKTRKKAKLQKVVLSDIHEKLLRYAMQESIRQLLKDIDKKVFLTNK